uniref:Uncharacterized protein n=1 Tax=Aegilops tauschii subsp. strangulata TaxID=200361 RepID=A0A452XHH3_AEGTS
ICFCSCLHAYVKEIKMLTCHNGWLEGRLAPPSAHTYGRNCFVSHVWHLLGSNLIGEVVEKLLTWSKLGNPFFKLKISWLRGLKNQEE